MKDTNAINSITQKVLETGTVSEIIAFANSGGRSIPVVKLTRREMQALRGGLPMINICSLAVPLYQAATLYGTDAEIDATVKIGQACGYDWI